MGVPAREGKQVSKPWDRLTPSKKKTAAFKELWEFLAKEVDARKKDDAEEVAAQAFDQIVAAVSDYEAASHTVWDMSADSFARKPNVANTRQALKEVEADLTSMHSYIQEMPLQARRLLARARGVSFEELNQTLAQLIEAARCASHKAQSLPDKTSNDALVLLARDVAQVMLTILKEKPAATRPAPDGKNLNGGALYGRLLQMTLKVVDINQVNIGRVIDDGLHLLKTPGLVRGDRS